jgi:hypothetical protein
MPGMGGRDVGKVSSTKPGVICAAPCAWARPFSISKLIALNVLHRKKWREELNKAQGMVKVNPLGKTS